MLVAYLILEKENSENSIFTGNKFKIPANSNCWMESNVTLIGTHGKVIYWSRCSVDQASTYDP